MYIDGNKIIMAGSVVSALLLIGGLFVGFIKWFQKQEKQSADIEELRNTHNEDIEEIKGELCVITYGLLAALDGLKQLGANGDVTDAHSKLEKHMNQQAHKQL